MSTSAAEINRSFDLLSLVEQDTSLKKTGAHFWAGPCPFCGGVDRFLLKHTPAGMLWYCRHCGGDRYHTAIDYIIQRQSCTFRQALGWAAHEGSTARDASSARRGGDDYRLLQKIKTNFPGPPLSQSTPTDQPDHLAWRSRAALFLASASASLWSPSGELALRWLRARGLKDDILQRFHLGYHPQDTFEPLADWGLPDPDDGQRHAVWLPRGIVIPCLELDQLWYLKIRRPVPETTRPTSAGSPLSRGSSAPQSSLGGLGTDAPLRGASVPKKPLSVDDANALRHHPHQKYVKIKGSQPGLFGADNLIGAWLAVLTEGELDCLLLHQEAGDLVGVATLGSAADRISQLDLAIWGDFLLPIAHLLVAYDLDEPGQKGSRALQSFTQRAIHISLPELPGVKDITDFHLAGGDLPNWICRTVERLNLL